MFRRILAYCIFAIGILIILFFRSYEGEMIPYPVVFIVLGVFMLIVAYIILRRMPVLKSQLEHLKRMHDISDLKANGIRIDVNLADCEIRDNSYQAIPEADAGTGFPEGIGDLEKYFEVLDNLKNPVRDRKLAEIHQSILIFKTIYNNRSMRFISRVLPKDKATISFLLDNQKRTALYVDKTDPTRYFFDLDFLNK